MEPEKNFCAIIKVKFEERKRNLLGLFIVAVETRHRNIVSCTPVIDYFTEAYAEEAALVISWDILLETIKYRSDKINDQILIDLSDQIRQRFELFIPERIDRLIRIFRGVSNFTLRNKMVHELITEDLKSLFRQGDLEIEINVEISSSVPQKLVKGKKKINPEKDEPVPEEDQTPDSGKSKKKKVKKDTEAVKKDVIKEKKTKKVTTKETDTEVKKDTKKKPQKEPDIEKEDKQEDTNDKKKNDKAEVKEKTKAAEENVCTVELVVDPIDGLAAKELEVDDKILCFRTKGIRLPGKVLSVSTKGKKKGHLVVRIVLSEDLIGEADILKSALVHVEKENKTEEQPPPSGGKLFKIAIIIVALSLVAVIVAIVMSLL